MIFSFNRSFKLVIIHLVFLSFMFSCKKDDSNIFKLPSKLYYKNIEQGPIEVYVITNLADSSYVKLPQNESLTSYFLSLYESTYYEYKYKSINLDAFKVTMEIEDPITGSRFEDHFCHNIGNWKMEVYYNNSYSMELLATPPKTLRLPIYMSLFFKNGTGQIPYYLKPIPVIDEKPSIDALIKQSIKEFSLQVNDTVYLNRIDYVFQAN